MKNKLLLIFFLVCATKYLDGQTLNPDFKLADDFTNFFIGRWTGSGEFANGKTISADLTFKMSLDSSWISAEHTDLSPNRYKAFSMWGVDRVSGEFVAYAFDNFHGHRKFVSDGWKENRLVLTTKEYFPENGLVFEHFIYEKLSDRNFKMTYETSKDGIVWRMGDFLVFKRKQN